MCDVTFDDHAVHVSWKATELTELSPEERFAERVYESGRKHAVLELRKDTVTLKHLAELEEEVKVPPERGGYHFSDWERSFIRDVRRQHDETLDFTEKQRDKIKDIWQVSDLKKRVGPDEKVVNLFSNLSPARQAEMRERAKRVKLPWE